MFNFFFSSLEFTLNVHVVIVYLILEASSVNYDQYHTGPVAAQSFVYTVPQQSPYREAVAMYQTNVHSNEMPNVYTAPANNMSSIAYSQSYEQVNHAGE